MLLDASIPLSIEPATRPEQRIQFCDLEGVKRLASAAAKSPAVLDAISSHISGLAARSGFTRRALDQTRRKLFQVRPHEALKQAVEALDQMAADYESALTQSTEPSELPGQFAAGIAEQVVHEWLCAYGRDESEIVADATVRGSRGEPISDVNKSNIDRVWARPASKQAEAYECKNQPLRLLARYPTRKAAGNDLAYRKSKLWLMLELRKVLSRVSWDVMLACVTLRSKWTFLKGLEALAERPPDFRVYGIEDFGCDFPTWRAK